VLPAALVALQRAAQRGRRWPPPPRRRVGAVFSGSRADCSARMRVARRAAGKRGMLDTSVRDF